MQPPISPVLFALLLFFGMLTMLEIGRRVGIRRSKEPEGERSNLGVVEGAVFALFGLLMAFSFSGAASRFNEKRMLIAEEANTIETAYLRLRLVVPEEQRHLQELFRRYLDSRLEMYRKLPDVEAVRLELAASKKMQEEIWTEAVAATRIPSAHPAAGWLLLPALNRMIDIVNTRTMALQIHPPGIVYALLFVLGLICSLLAGFRMASGQNRSWLHILAFTTITVIVVYVILDLEYPRMGLFRFDRADQILVNLRATMN